MFFTLFLQEKLFEKLFSLNFCIAAPQGVLQAASAY